MSLHMIPENFADQLETKAAEKPDFKIMTFENGDYSDEVLTYGDDSARDVTPHLGMPAHREWLGSSHAVGHAAPEPQKVVGARII